MALGRGILGVFSKAMSKTVLSSKSDRSFVSSTVRASPHSSPLRKSMRSLATRVSEGSGTGLARWPLANLSPIGFKSHGEGENAAVAALIIRSASYAIHKHFNWFIYLCSTTRSRPDVSCTAYFLLSIFNCSAHGHWSAVWTRWAVREWKSSHRSHLENKKVQDPHECLILCYNELTCQNRGTGAKK